MCKRIIAAQLIQYFHGPDFTIEPWGAPSRPEDMETLNGMHRIVRASGDLSAWPPYNTIITADCGGQLADFLAQIE